MRQCLSFRAAPIWVAFLFLVGCASKEVASTSERTTSPGPKPAAEPKPAAHAIPQDRLPEAAARPPAPFEGDNWDRVFDGKTLAGWKETAFAGRGAVECEHGLIILNTGDPFTGVNLTNPFPTMNYEVALDAMRVSGSDFFCGLTVPVGEGSCSLIVGGWGGSLVGISSIDSMDASENETTKFINFEHERWYRIRLRVTEGRIEGWIDKEKLVDVVIGGRRISVRPGDIELSRPFGIAAWQTTAALREIRVRRVTSPADPPKER
jgi:hypothetical protein